MNRICLALWGVASAAALVPEAAAAQRQADGKLETLLRRASEYAENYGARLALVLATERYEQRVIADARSRGSGGSQQGQTRVLVSDVIWAPSDQEVVLLFYRDVYSVDGKAVRDRRDRLLPLFA